MHDVPVRRRSVDSRSPPAQYRNQRDEYRREHRQDERRQIDHRQEERRHDNFQRDGRRRNDFQRDERRPEKRRFSPDRRSSSGERKKPTLMSSVGAIVNHESDDEYNPIKMLKKSMASTIQVH